MIHSCFPSLLPHHFENEKLQLDCSSIIYAEKTKEKLVHVIPLVHCKNNNLLFYNLCTFVFLFLITMFFKFQFQFLCTR